MYDKKAKLVGESFQKYPPPSRTLLTRTGRGGRFSFINSAVALSDHISLKYLVPYDRVDLTKLKEFMFEFCQKGRNF